jgi:hypothetical protein
MDSEPKRQEPEIMPPVPNMVPGRSGAGNGCAQTDDRSEKHQDQQQRRDDGILLAAT